MNGNLVALAKELTRSKPADLPDKFLELEQLLQRSTASTSMKYDVIALDILAILLLTLRQDFTTIANGWRLAGNNLSPLACSCLTVKVDRTNTKTKAWSGQFLDKHLPQGVDSFLILTRRLQDRYNQERRSHLRQDYVTYMRRVMSNLLEVLDFHSNQYSLIKQVLVSSRFMELFLTDDAYICPMMINTFEDLVRKSRRLTGGSVFAELASKLKQDFVNELAYKLTVFEQDEVGKAAVRALIAVCETDANIISLLADKFKGLPTVLQRWQGHGFGMDIQELLAITRRSGKIGPYSREYKREDYAASRIQALWRGYLSRKRLIKANQAMKMFQNSFRQRKLRETQTKERDRLRAEVQYQATREHYRRLRQYKLQHIRTIELLPASEVEKFLEVQRLESATTIQAFFRGHLQRRRMTQGQRDRLIAEQAARKIQRTFRRYRQRKQAALDRRQQQLEYTKPSILTEAKREEIIEQIDHWRSERAPRAMSDEEFHALHSRGQENLQRYVSTNRVWRSIEQRQRILLHMMNNDSEFLLTNYSKLKSAMQPGGERNATTEQLDQAASYLTHPSSAVRYRARQDHIDALKFVRAPWYKTLQLANLNDDEDEDDEEYLKRAGLDDFGRNDILNNPNRYEYEKSKFYFFEPMPMTQSIQRH